MSPSRDPSASGNSTFGVLDELLRGLASAVIPGGSVTVKLAAKMEMANALKKPTLNKKVLIKLHHKMVLFS